VHAWVGVGTVGVRVVVSRVRVMGDGYVGYSLSLVWCGSCLTLGAFVSVSGLQVGG